MKRRGLVFVGLFVFIFAFLFLGRGIFKILVFMPIYILWQWLKVWIMGLSQPMIWVTLIAVIGASALVTILPAMDFEEKEKTHVKTMRGKVEDLASLLEDANRRTYFDKWLVANRLGENAWEILAQRAGEPVSKRFGVLDRKNGWNPPPKVETYLNTGLQSSLIGRPNPRWSLRGKKLPPTPLDLDLDQVLEYLESEMDR
jgi:hypothetical protein